MQPSQALIFLRETDIRINPNNSLYTTIIPQTQKETITMPSIKHFFVLMALLVFIFRATVFLLASDKQKIFHNKFQ